MVQTILYLALTIASIAFVRVIFTGRHAKKYRLHLPNAVPNHRSAGIFGYCSMLSFVILIEFFAWIRNVPHDTLFYVHLGFALPFAVGYSLLVSLMNGEKSEYHASIAYVTLGFFLLTAGTGIPMIQRFG